MAANQSPPSPIGVAVSLVGHASTAGAKPSPSTVGLGCSLVGHLAEVVVPQQIDPEVEPENFIEIRFVRPPPGDQDPATRKLEAEKGIKADFIIYDHKGNDIKRGKYAKEDGSPQHETLPKDVVNVTVRFEHDNDYEFEIMHEPKPHGLVDGTKAPTPAQLARFKSLRIA